jgi:hypothetical protein
MKHNVYLPDDVSEPAKAAKLNLSGLLRDAVIDELERRAGMAETLEEVEEYEVSIYDQREDRGYTGRITGKLIAMSDDENVQVFLTDDERVIVYDSRDEDYFVVEDDPSEELRKWLSDEAYADAMNALGLKAIIDL